MTKKPVSTGSAGDFFNRVRLILTRARQKALQSVNALMVQSYWEIGREIVIEEQKGRGRAGYGDELIAGLSRELISDFGKGFSPRNLLYIRNFYLAYPKSQALPAELSWTHYRLLSNIARPDARTFYQNECIHAHWSTRELERQINSLLLSAWHYQRTKPGFKLLVGKDMRCFNQRILSRILMF